MCFSYSLNKVSQRHVDVKTKLRPRQWSTITAVLLSKQLYKLHDSWEKNVITKLTRDLAFLSDNLKTVLHDKLRLRAYRGEPRRRIEKVW